MAIIKILVAVCFAIALVTLSRANADSSGSAANPGAAAAAPTDPVVARGKGFEIRRSQMDQVLATARARDPLSPLPADAEVRAINQLIDIQLVWQKATDTEKAEGASEADATIAGILKAQGPAEFQRRLNATRMTEDQLRLMLSQENTAQVSLTRQLGVNVTDADAKKFFDEHPGAWDQPERAHVREILIMTSVGNTSAPLSKDALVAREKLIYSLYARVRAGEDLAALAKQYNEDPYSKDTGGELTFRRIKKEFGNLAFSMKPGQISEVLANSDGFRIFQLIGFVPPRKADFATLCPLIKKGLTEGARRQLAPVYLSQLRKDGGVEILDPELKAKIAVAEVPNTPSATAAKQE